MRGRPVGHPWRLFAIGAALCLLAALFAFEAKLAWFSPAGTSCKQISATKLQPADAPKLIAQALATRQAAHHFPAEPRLLAGVAFLVAQIPQSFNEVDHKGFKPLFSLAFSPHLFRRPPPKS